MIVSLTNSSRQISLRKVPKTCPYCHHAITPDYVAGLTRPGVGSTLSSADITFQCPACRRLFVAGYRKADATMVLKSVPAKFLLEGVANAQPQLQAFEPAILDLSPSFAEIYHQAQAAEQNGLNQIAGLGYRKALEFLVKDYLIRESPEDAETIKQTFLGQCITRLKDDRIRAAVERAVWLGNDEAHYVRRWQDMDVSDLKRIIGLVLAHLHLEDQHQLLQRQMPAPKPK
ncbi:DUF4145 domain-containing protein [Hymenobacter guriensis]|nr:DUF4145 domain-containing protein [Hymenobacter guriensis]